ncbi:hypothetical protein CR513_27474, partial [Mucuna pruriens]
MEIENLLHKVIQVKRQLKSKNSSKFASSSSYVTHDGVTNRFSFEHLGQKVIFKPLSPRQVCDNHMKMKKKIEEERKEIEKVKKAKRKEKRKKKGVKSKKEVSKRNVEKKEALMVSWNEVKKILLAMKEVLFLLPTNMCFHRNRASLILPWKQHFLIGLPIEQILNKAKKSNKLVEKS